MKIPRANLLLATAIVLASSATPAAARPMPGNSREFADQLRAADRNKDGQVSRSELVSYRATQWTRFDRNADGYFSRDDLPGFIQNRWDDDKIVQLRRSYDRDGDGRISRGEFVNGPTPAFDAADTNRDGLVNEVELRAMASQVRG